MQDHDIFWCKIYSEAIFLGLNLTLHMHTLIYKYSKYPPGISLRGTAVNEFQQMIRMGVAGHIRGNQTETNE